MSDLLSALKDTPIPTILVGSGIFFLLLAVVGTVAGKITVQPGQQWFAALVGAALVGLGLFVIYFAPPSRSEKEMTAAPSPQPPAQSNPPQPPAQTSRYPSFDCKTNHQPDEIAICNSGSLSYLDLQLDELYRALRIRLGKDEQARLAEEQNAWVSERNSCRGDESCLTKTYEARIAQLQSRR